MAYFTSISDTWRRLATYVDGVLKGAKPGELPVEQAVKFELIGQLEHRPGWLHPRPVIFGTGAHLGAYGLDVRIFHTHRRPC